jgi:hypothetical protein
MDGQDRQGKKNLRFEISDLKSSTLILSIPVNSFPAAESLTPKSRARPARVKVPDA